MNLQFFYKNFHTVIKKKISPKVIDHTDNVLAQETEDPVATMEVEIVAVDLPPVGSTQTVETSNPDTSSPPMSPQPIEIVAEEFTEEEETAPESPKIVAISQVFADTIDEHGTSIGSFSPSRIIYATATGEFKNTGGITATAQFITASPTRPFSPVAEPQRLPSVLEAAIKAEPKVEVERYE